MRKSSLLYAIMLFLCPLLSFAQKKTITGKISDATTGSPLENVSIKIKSTKSGVVTDKKGLFTINVSVNDVLVISYVGYTDQEVTVGNTDEINIVLQQSVTDLSQLVIVGSRTGGRIKNRNSCAGRYCEHEPGSAAHLAHGYYFGIELCRAIFQLQ